MARKEPCGCERVGGGWNVSECTCPSLRLRTGPHYRWPTPGRALEAFASEVDRSRAPCYCIRLDGRWNAGECTCPALQRLAGFRRPQHDGVTATKAATPCIVPTALAPHFRATLTAEAAHAA